MKVRCHVVFGRSGFLLPRGVQRRPTLGIRAWSILSMWPSRRIRLMLLQRHIKILVEARSKEVNETVFSDRVLAL